MGKVKSISQYRLTPGFGGFTPVSYETIECCLPCRWRSISWLYQWPRSEVAAYCGRYYCIWKRGELVNNRRLLERLDHIPPAEAEKTYYASIGNNELVA